jgi:putative addiction module CopG family antidote
MALELSDDVRRILREKVTTGAYRSADELILTALGALEELEHRRETLQVEIQDRLTRTGTDRSTPLVVPDFVQEMRRRHSTPK